MDENKRKNILFTAMKLFNEKGFHGTPTSLIAKRAKVSVGTLFNYYQTKESIYVFAIRKEKTDFIAIPKDKIFIKELNYVLAMIQKHQF